MSADIIQFKGRSRTLDEAVGAALDKHLPLSRVEEWIQILEEETASRQEAAWDCARRLRHLKSLRESLRARLRKPVTGNIGKPVITIDDNGEGA